MLDIKANYSQCSQIIISRIVIYQDYYFCIYQVQVRNYSILINYLTKQSISQKLINYRSFQKMNCRQCLTPFANNKNSLPRVLINCGHTLCQSCIQKTFQDRQIACPQCGQVSFGISFHQYPVNATLISLLREQAVCKVHNQKLEAYCEKDNELLCLSCVIGNQHKSHKISSISEKVTKDRSILKQCMRQIEQSCEQIQSTVKTTNEGIEKLEGQYKDYLLEVGMCFNTIRENLQQLQDSCLKKAKQQYELIIQKYQKLITEMQEKKQFMNELSRMFDEVMNLPNIQYLHQDNKRLFIIQNSKIKKPKIQINRLAFNKINTLNQISANIQQLINYQKKLQGQCTPSLKTKKSNRNKQPTILQVNLNEQYKKHFKSSAENNQNPITNSTSSLNTNMFSNANQNQLIISKTKTRHQRPKGFTNANTSQQKNIQEVAKTPKQDREKQNYKKQAITVSAASQFSINSACDKNNNSFHSDSLPFSMINSFMESSTNRTLSMKGSEAQFTMVNYEQKIFHFGGFNDSSIQFCKVDEPKCSKIVSQVNIERSKAQCAIIPSLSEHKCLIFGGKSSSDQKMDTFLQYNILTNKIQTSLFKLSEPKSGFGSAVKENKLYIAGGSNSQRSLKIFQEYRVSSNSMVKTDMPSMNHCRDELGLVLGFDGNIYACGGINQSGSMLSSCERFNQSKGRWELISSMNKPRRSFALVSLPHGIYAIGGYDGTDYLRQVQLYDFTLQKWITIASMNQPRFAHTAIATTDFQNIIVSGGFYKKPLKSTEILDVINEKWSEGLPLQTERFLHCSLVVNN